MDKLTFSARFLITDVHTWDCSGIVSVIDHFFQVGPLH